MGVGHYENFPVASWLVPRPLRAPIHAIYRFARHADDIADEGDAQPAERVAALDALRAELDRIEAGDYPPSGAWAGLAAAVQAHALPVALLRDLLSAFEQDARGAQYSDEAALLDYCRRSANPIGRLLLALYRRSEPQLCAWSDSICTGLQLANFWQDIAIDYAKGRVYIPDAALARCGVAREQIAQQRTDANWQRLVHALTQDTRRRLLEGAPLARALGGRLGLELRLVIQGGLRICEQLDAAHGDVFRRRPRLQAPDWVLLAGRAISMP
jgi:squalene synthase HpnC